jgi:serine/threonine protein kinase
VRDPCCVLTAVVKELESVNLPNFEILGLLGKGGMAAVWKARQISLDRMVAVKILASSFIETEEDLKQFRQEARTAAQLKHPNIVQVYDANFSNGSCYFVMELVEGYTHGRLASSQEEHAS